MAKIDTFVDNFDDNSINGTLWPNNFGTVAETGGRARADCDAGELAGWQSANNWDLEDSSFLCSVPVVPDGAGATAARLVVSFNHPTGDGRRVGFEFDGVNDNLVLINERGTPPLFQTGFENGTEWDTTAGSPTISTDRPHLGANSLEINPTNATEYIQNDCAASNVSPWGIRAFVNFDSFPTNGTIPILQWLDGVNREEAGIRVTTSGTLIMTSNGSQVGSPTSQIVLDTWHELIIHINSFGNGAETFLNGTSIASIAETDIGENSLRLRAGAITAASGMLLYIDDIEVNRDQVFDFDPREEIPYNSTNHLWIRLAESGASINFDTSTDGSSWTTQRTVDTPPWVESQTTGFLSFETNRAGGTDDFAELDNLNVSTPINEVDTSFPFSLTAPDAVARAQHNVSGSVALTLAEAAVTRAQHNVNGSVDLTLAVTAEVSVDNEVQATFPFTLDLDAVSVRDQVIVATIPLSLGATAETELFPVVLGPIPLSINLGGVGDKPHVANAPISLSIVFNAESKFTPIIGDLNVNVQAMQVDTRNVVAMLTNLPGVAAMLNHPTQLDDMRE